jgi:hypothetical protein
MAEKDTIKVRILTLIILSMLATPLLADNYDDTLKRWESFVESNPLGSSSDFWLEKNTILGWQKVTLVFGYGDDYYACNNILKALEVKYSAAQYRCTRANKVFR